MQASKEQVTTIRAAHDVMRRSQLPLFSRRLRSARLAGTYLALRGTAHAVYDPLIGGDTNAVVVHRRNRPLWHPRVERF